MNLKYVSLNPDTALAQWATDKHLWGSISQEVKQQI